ncbi:MAG: hypothetical protein E7208_06265 [Clostridium butyricum]|nr:hypothetical protein [Clostridium butyricum]
MFFSYPDEYSIPVNYVENLVREEKIIVEEKSEAEFRYKENLLRNLYPFSKKEDYSTEDSERVNYKKSESIFNIIDEQFIEEELKNNI